MITQEVTRITPPNQESAINLSILTVSVFCKFKNRSRGLTRQGETDLPTTHLLEHPAPRDTQPPFPFSHWNLLQKAICHVRSCHGTAAKQHEVNQKRRIMNVSTSTKTLHECCFFICLAQSTIAQVSRSKRWVCETLRSPATRVTDAPSRINCSAPTDSSHVSCALLAQCSTTQA